MLIADVVQGCPLWAPGTLDLVPKRERRPWQAAVDLNRSTRTTTSMAAAAYAISLPVTTPCDNAAAGLEAMAVPDDPMRVIKDRFVTRHRIRPEYLTLVAEHAGLRGLSGVGSDR